MKPGIYPGLSMPEYLTMKAVSASMLKTIIERCPFAAWHESWLNPQYTVEASSPECDAGTIAHSILLDGHSNMVEVIDPQDHPNEKGGGFAQGWTNKSIKLARAQAIAAGKIPVLPPTMVQIDAMVATARAYLDSVKRDEPAIYAAFQPQGGASEVTMVWDDNGVLCRIRPDRITSDNRLIVDYKTGLTTAEPDTWGRRQMTAMGYYTSAAFYRRGVLALTGEACEYVFLVQEQDAPYLCSLVGVDPKAMELGTKKIAHALHVYSRCLSRNEWPAYPTKVCYPELPPWEFAGWEETLGNIEQLRPRATKNPYDPGRLYEPF